MHSKFPMPNLCHRLLAMPVAPNPCKTSLVTLLRRNCGNNDLEIKQRKETGTCDRYPPFREEEKKIKGIYKCILEIHQLNKCVSRYPAFFLMETVATEWFWVVNGWNSFCSLCGSCDFVHRKQQSAAPANPFSPSWVFLGLCSPSSSMLAWNQINIFQRVLQMLFITKVL